VAQIKLDWQSKLVLLAVMPFAAADVVLETHWWAVNAAPVALWTVGLSLLLGLVALRLRAATLAGAAAGAVLMANLIFSTAAFPYRPWHTALIPALAVSLLAWAATRLGREQKERLGTAERRRGRQASQIAANLGVATLVYSEFAQAWLQDTHWFATHWLTSHRLASHWFTGAALAPMPLFAAGLAALAEAAADTVSSEIGQVIGGRPRLLTNLRTVHPGTDGAVSLLGSLAGIVAAGMVAALGALALRGGLAIFWIGCAGGVFGLFFDSLLGATLERRGWLNNDAVNFLSTAGAAAFALGLLGIVSLFGPG
jgi:uncharacterized membrane protein